MLLLLETKEESSVFKVIEEINERATPFSEKKLKGSQRVGHD